MARFGGVFEHSPWIAEAAFARGLPPGPLTADGVWRAMCAAMRAGTDAQKQALIDAHPDLAGKLAMAGRLTRESAAEQASAGLDMLTDEERERFVALNDAYKARFGMPFIMAVKEKDKAEILAAFERRLTNDRASEIATALDEIERIARLRLEAMLGGTGE